MAKESEFTTTVVKVSDANKGDFFTLGTQFSDGESFQAKFPDPANVELTYVQKAGWSKPMAFTDVLNIESGLIETIGMNKLSTKIVFETDRTATFNVRAASYTKANGKEGIGLAMYQAVEKVEAKKE